MPEVLGLFLYSLDMFLGAVFLQHLVLKFDELYESHSYTAGKEMDNIIVLLSHLYNFKVSFCQVLP